MKEVTIDLYGADARSLRTSGQFQGARSERRMAKRERNVTLDWPCGRLVKSAGFHRNPANTGEPAQTEERKSPN